MGKTFKKYKSKYERDYYDSGEIFDGVRTKYKKHSSAEARRNRRMREVKDLDEIEI